MGCVTIACWINVVGQGVQVLHGPALFFSVAATAKKFRQLKRSNLAKIDSLFLVNDALPERVPELQVGLHHLVPRRVLLQRLNGELDLAQLGILSNLVNTTETTLKR